MSAPPPHRQAKRTGKRITFFREAAMKEAEPSEHAMKEAGPREHAMKEAGPNEHAMKEAGPREATSTVTHTDAHTDAHTYLSSVIFSPDRGEQRRGHHQQTVTWAPQRQAAWDSWDYSGYAFSKSAQSHQALPSAQSYQGTPSAQSYQGTPSAQSYQGTPSAQSYQGTPSAQSYQGTPSAQSYQGALKPLNAQQTVGAVLQPFQLAFGQNKTQQLPSYDQAFRGSSRTGPALQPPALQPPAPQPPAPPVSQAPQSRAQPLLAQHLWHEQRPLQPQRFIEQSRFLCEPQAPEPLIQDITPEPLELSIDPLLHVTQREAQSLRKPQNLENPFMVSSVFTEPQNKAHTGVAGGHTGAGGGAGGHTGAGGGSGGHTGAGGGAGGHTGAGGGSGGHTGAGGGSGGHTGAGGGAGGAAAGGHTGAGGAAGGHTGAGGGSGGHTGAGGAAGGYTGAGGGAGGHTGAGGGAGGHTGAGGGHAGGGQTRGGGGQTRGGGGHRGGAGGAATGVIQSTRRKRRVSQEVNLETLAQKASEMESLPHNQDRNSPWNPEDEVSKQSRDDLVPLVIPVSVPVHRPSASESREDPGLVPDLVPGLVPGLGCGWTPRDLNRPDHKPSVIVTRRRSLRTSVSDSAENGADMSLEDDSKKLRRRPRPEPLFIPPPKPSVFIAPSLYSSISSYQSHLRSPVRMGDLPLCLPPYTPPPILSPVREGSGLYFSTFLTAALPPATPKSATRSLLRTNSCDITPPVLTSIGEATPVSLEPRINIGCRYQAEIPELRPAAAVEQDHHQAALVWAPLKDLEENPGFQRRVQDLLLLSCSSVFSGGGTNLELAHHCLFHCRGDVLAALSLMMLRTPLFPKSHPLSSYHYSGSDHWSSTERKQFNRGIAAHKKDFFMVQKQVHSKSVSQCVEFYYTYKKHVKMGRNGELQYGETPAEGREDAQRLEEDSRKWEGSADRKQEVAQVIQPTDNNCVPHEDPLHLPPPPPRLPPPPPRLPPPPPRLPPPPPRLPKPRHEPQPRKHSPNSGHKGAPAAEGEFPCKKCGRVFLKVKSRSAHMKSHSEQEKKAAAQRQKEQQRHNGTSSQPGGDTDSSTDQDSSDRDWR